MFRKPRAAWRALCFNVVDPVQLQKFCMFTVNKQPRACNVRPGDGLCCARRPAVYLCVHPTRPHTSERRPTDRFPPRNRLCCALHPRLASVFKGAECLSIRTSGQRKGARFSLLRGPVVHGTARVRAVHAWMAAQTALLSPRALCSVLGLGSPRLLLSGHSRFRADTRQVAFLCTPGTLRPAPVPRCPTCGDSPGHPTRARPLGGVPAPLNAPPQGLAWALGTPCAPAHWAFSLQAGRVPTPFDPGLWRVYVSLSVGSTFRIQRERGLISSPCGSCTLSPPLHVVGSFPRFSRRPTENSRMQAIAW